VNPNNDGNPVFFMSPFGHPMMGMGPREQHNPATDTFVPPRVEKAMEFVQMMMSKQQIRPAANDISIEQIPGQKLSHEEANTLAQACNYLTRYFEGDAALDVWERMRVKSIRTKMTPGVTTGRVINCIVCDPRRANPDCILCHGAGTILCTPMHALSLAQESPPEQPPTEEPG